MSSGMRDSGELKPPPGMGNCGLRGSMSPLEYGSYTSVASAPAEKISLPGVELPVPNCAKSSGSYVGL